MGPARRDPRRGPRPRTAAIGGLGPELPATAGQGPLGLSSTEGTAVGVGAAAVAVGLGVGFGVGLGVGFGVGFGVARGASGQLLTPEPEVRPDDAGTAYFAIGSTPVGGNRTATSLRIARTSGTWIEPRLSYVPLTSGWPITARKVCFRPILAATSARSGTSLRGMLVETVSPRARTRPIGSPRNPPAFTRSRTPDRISCWRAARVKSFSPAAFRTRAKASAWLPLRWCRPAVMAKPSR